MWDIAMKKTLFITMLAAALLGGNVYANTGFSGGMLIGGALDNTAELACMLLGASEPGGDDCYNTVWVREGTHLDAVWGGRASKDLCSADGNTIIVTGGKIDQLICGGWASGEYQADASGNKVYITGLSAGCVPEEVRGGWATPRFAGASNNNEVHLVGEGAAISIENERLEGHSMTLGNVWCGVAPEEKFNSVHIYGSGISAQSVSALQILNFYLVDGHATAEAPMLALSGTTESQALRMANFSLNILADAAMDWGVLAGHTVTLVESQLAIQGFGDNPYKVVNVINAAEYKWEYFSGDPLPTILTKGILTLGNEGKELRLKVLRPGTEVLAPGESRQAGSATITALSQTEPGLLDNLTLKADTILGQGRAASLADGLKIESTADLMIQSMTITANNEIHVGEHTITLKDVTIKISDDVCQPVNGIYTIDLRNLINCDLVMENVLLDASDLSLPEGFDPATTSVVFDFGDDVTIKQATGLDMRLGNFWSPSLNLDQQGKVIFTKLVETPEPTTGTLSLLALAALAARRRKK